MKTIKEEVIEIYEEKKSKFITYLKPIKSKEEAINYIDYISEKNKDATHNVYAYIINDGVEQIKYSDDGEPKDTAGKPAYEVLKMRNIENVVVVISRYFGGVKLGAGGLIRAYAAAVKKALDSAKICDIQKKIAVVIDIPYSKFELIKKIIDEEDANNYEVEFNENVVIRCQISEETLKKIKEINNIIII